MLCHEPLITQAARNRRIPIGLRFAAQRLVELLDGGSPLVDSAAFYLSADTAATDALELLKAYRTSPSHFRLRTLEALSRFVALASVVDACLEGVATAAPALRATQNARDSIANKRPDLTSAVAEAVGRLEDLGRDIGDGRMVDHARTAIIASLGTLNNLDEGDRLGPWAGFDHRLRTLAGALLGEGRGQITAYTLGEALARARDADEAQRLFEDTISSRQSDFDVVIVMQGSGRIRLAAGQGFEVLADLPSFAGAAPSAVTSVLRLFARETGHGRGDARALRTRIAARDPEHAARRAILRGKELADRLNAVQRQGRFSLHPTALVRNITTETVLPISVAPETRPAFEVALGAETFADRPLNSSLAYMRRAHNSSSPIGVVMHTWIALEALHTPLAGSHRPQDDVISFAPIIAGGRAVAGIELRSWNTLAWQRGGGAAWEHLKESIGKTDPDGKRRRHCRPPAWRSALTQTSAQYTRQLSDVLRISTPLVRWKIGETRRLITKREALRERSNEVVRNVRWAAERMRVTRNRAAHEALATAPGEEQLARAARLLADAVFEGMQGAARNRNAAVPLIQQAIDEGNRILNR